MTSFDDEVKSCLREHIQSLRILNEKLTELDTRLRDLHDKGLDEEFLLEAIQNVRIGVQKLCCNARNSIINGVEKRNRGGRASNRRSGETLGDHFYGHHYDRDNISHSDGTFM